MKSENETIADDEWLLRRIFHDKFKSDRVPEISPNAFEPRVNGREPDTDGISLYRESCLSAAEDVLATIAPEKRHLSGIARIRVSTIIGLGYTLRISPVEQIRGHIVVPEMNSEDYKKNKAAFTEAKQVLAEEASQEGNILKRPAP